MVKALVVVFAIIFKITLALAHMPEMKLSSLWLTIQIRPFSETPFIWDDNNLYTSKEDCEASLLERFSAGDQWEITKNKSGNTVLHNGGLGKPYPESKLTQAVVCDSINMMNVDIYELIK